MCLPFSTSFKFSWLPQSAQAGLTPRIIMQSSSELYEILTISPTLKFIFSQIFLGRVTRPFISIFLSVVKLLQLFFSHGNIPFCSTKSAYISIMPVHK